MLTLLLLTWSAKHNVEVQPVDADGRVVLDSQVDVFLDTEAKVASAWEVVPPQLVLSHLSDNHVPFTDNQVSVHWLGL